MQMLVVVVKILCSGVKQPRSNPPFTIIRCVTPNKLLNQSAFQCLISQMKITLVSTVMSYCEG